MSLCKQFHITLFYNLSSLRCMYDECRCSVRWYDGRNKEKGVENSPL